MPMMLDDNDEAEGMAAPRAAHWGFWGTLIWGILILVIGSVLQTTAILAVAVWRSAEPWKHSGSELVGMLISTDTDGVVLSIAILVSSALGGSLVIGVIKLKKRSDLREYLCIERVSLATMWNWLCLLTTLFVITGLLKFTFGHADGAEFASVAYATANPVWMFWVATIIAAPLFEEMFFRGFLLRGFAASFMGPIGAVVVTSGAWATVHLQYDAFDVAILFCIGLLFGTARLVTGSLLVPLALHATENLIGMAAAAMSQ